MNLLNIFKPKNKITEGSNKEHSTYIKSKCECDHSDTIKIKIRQKDKHYFACGECGSFITYKVPDYAHSDMKSFGVEYVYADISLKDDLSKKDFELCCVNNNSFIFKRVKKYKTIYKMIKDNEVNIEDDDIPLCIELYYNIFAEGGIYKEITILRRSNNILFMDEDLIKRGN